MSEKRVAEECNRLAAMVADLRAENTRLSGALSEEHTRANAHAAAAIKMAVERDNAISSNDELEGGMQLIAEICGAMNIEGWVAADIVELVRARVTYAELIEGAAVNFLVTFNNHHYGRVPDEVDAARIRLATALRENKNPTINGAGAAESAPRNEAPVADTQGRTPAREHGDSSAQASGATHSVHEIARESQKDEGYSDPMGEYALELEDVLTRIRAWDMLDATADGPYWKRELDAVLEGRPVELRHQSCNQPKERNDEHGIAGARCSRGGEGLLQESEAPAQGHHGVAHGGDSTRAGRGDGVGGEAGRLRDDSQGTRQEVGSVLQVNRHSDLIKAVRALVFVARTSGGTAGRDEPLCTMLDVVESLLPPMVGIDAGGDEFVAGQKS